MKYHKIPNLFENQSALVNGKEIGSGTIRYIQDSGQKVTGNTYIDRNTNELYLCVTTTNSVNNDGNFKKFNLKEAFNKLDNLGNTSLKWTFLGTIKTTNGTLTVPNGAIECLIYTRDVSFTSNQYIMSSHLIKTDFDIGTSGRFGVDGQIFFSYTKSNRVIKVYARGQNDESIDVFYR